MNYHIDIQKACDDYIPVPDATLSKWALLPLERIQDSGEITLRIVSSGEIQHLNLTYRKQDKPTNVLAFKSDIPEQIMLDTPFLGDVIICPAILKAESDNLNKPLVNHWAHIIIHGVLHLLGYDHINDEDAAIMQPVETELLARLGFEDPYHYEENKE
jgi:probable rRNA maturation factor